jgi:hypothetical protein
MTVRLPLGVILLVIAGTGFGAPAPKSSLAEQPSLDLSQYIAELERGSAAVHRLKEHPDEAGSLRKELPTEWTVVASGQKYVVPAAWFSAKLNALESDHSRAAEISGEVVARLDAMRAGAQAMAAAQSMDTPFARRRLDDILKRREYRGVTGPNPIRSWWDRATDWLSDKLAALLNGARRYGVLSATLLWLLAGGLALFLLVWLVRSVLRISTGTRLKLESPPLPESADWAQQALACANRGDYREAIRLAYSLAMARLEENGLWQLNAARTPREYLRLMPREHARRPPLAALTRRLERACYGGKAVSQEDFRGALVELGDLGCPLDWSPATTDSF